MISRQFKHILALAGLVTMVAGLSMRAEKPSARTALETMPTEIALPLNPRTTGDLIEYYLAGMTDHTEPNMAGGQARILELDSLSAKVQVSDGCRLTLHVLPCGRDTLLMVIETIDAPQPDSRMNIYRGDWSKPKKTLWKSPERTPAETDIILTEYTYDPLTRILTLKDRRAGSDSILNSRRYEFSSKGFKPGKNQE